MKIIFVCAGNTCRSPLAEGLMKNLLEKNGINDIQVTSCGLCAKKDDKIAENSQKALEKRGIKFEHSAQGCASVVIERGDLVVAMERNMLFYLQSWSQLTPFVRCIDDFTGKGDVADPYGGSEQDYDIVCEQLINASQNICKSIGIVLK